MRFGTPVFVNCNVRKCCIDFRQVVSNKLNLIGLGQVELDRGQKKSPDVATGYTGALVSAILV